MQHPELPSLRAEVQDAMTKKLPAIIVDSPPGAGKTLLVENIAAELAHLGYAVAVGMPGFQQSLAFTRRLRQSSSGVGIRLWMGQHRVLPAGLADEARPGAKGSFLLGPAVSPPVQVGTIAKYEALEDRFNPVDVLIVDEAHQVTFSTFEPLLEKARLHVLVGDPGQLAPTVRIDTEPFENVRYRPHLPLPIELARHNPGIPILRLSQTYRFPDDTARLLQPFYPQLPFTSALAPTARGVRLRNKARVGDAIDRAIEAIAAGASLVAVTLPRTSRPSALVDHALLDLVAEVTVRLMQRQPVLPDGRVINPGDVGCVEPHVAFGEGIRRRIASRLGSSGAVFVTTPEVWQGLERPFVVTRQPVTDALTEFDVDPGRLCVATSRHQFGCLVVAHPDLDVFLDGMRLDAGRRPLGSSNESWRGVQAHKAVWSMLQAQGRVFPLS